MISGQDWSSYQPEAPSTGGLAFVFVKRTEGTGYVNPRAHAQVAHARAEGLVVGHYHYPHIANSASSEADYFLKELGADLHAGDILALDWEWYGQKVSAAQARAYKAAFISRIRLRAPSHRIVVYCNRSDWTHVDTDSTCGDGLWIADPTTAGRPRIQHPWTFHQYSTAGGVDHDVAGFATTAELRAWAAGNTTTEHDQEDNDMQPTDTLPVPPWALTQWPTDKGLADKTIEVQTALSNGYAHSRATHDATTAILAQLGALNATIAALAKGGSLTADQIAAAAKAGAQAALAELGQTLTTPPTTN